MRNAGQDPRVVEIGPLLGPRRTTISRATGHGAVGRSIGKLHLPAVKSAPAKQANAFVIQTFPCSSAIQSPEHIKTIGERNVDVLPVHIEKSLIAWRLSFRTKAKLRIGKIRTAIRVAT
jgi:hypothetical protein